MTVPVWWEEVTMPHLHRFGLAVLATLLPLLLWLPPSVAQAPTAPAGDQSLDPALTRSLQSNLHYERLSGFRQLAGLKSMPVSALPLLATGLKDEDEAVRLTAAAALAGVTGAVPEAARIAATALQDASPLVRQFAVRAASCLHDTSGVSAGLLKAASQDSDATVRGLASAGLKQLEGVGSGTEGVRTGGVEGAAQPGGSAQGTNTGTAAGTTASTGGQPRTGTATTPAAAPGTTSAESPDANSLPALIAALSDPNPEVRLRAAQSLGEMGTRAIPALPALERARADADVRVRQKAEWAIAQIWRPAKATSDQPALAPPEGRIFFLSDIVQGCDEKGPELQDDLSCTGSGSTADLFKFTTLSYLDLAELKRYREDARKRGLHWQAPLAELCTEDPDWEKVAPKFPFMKTYLKDHVIAITCNGQTRFQHLRYDAGGNLHKWGGGAHYRLTNGMHKVQVQVFTCEGFRLKFEYEFKFEREGNIPAHLAAYRGPADVGVPDRQLIRELEEEDKPISAWIADLGSAAAETRSKAAQKLGRYGAQAASARSALEPLTKDANWGVAKAAESAILSIDSKQPPDPGLGEYRKERAARWAGLAGVLWDAALHLVGWADRDCDDVMPYLQEAAVAMRTSHSLYPPGAANNATISGIGYTMGVINDGRLWPVALESMAFYEDALRPVPIPSKDFWDRQRWAGWAAAWHSLASASITYRNDVARFWAFEDRWLAQGASLIDATGRPLEFNEPRNHDAWPQPGWWRSEWNDILPPEPENPELPTEETPQQVAGEPAQRDDLLAQLGDTLNRLSDSRSLEERWIGDLWDALVTAEQKKAEALGLLRAQAQVAEGIRRRLGYLRNYLAKQPDPEAVNYWEAAFRLAMDAWNDGWGPRPRVEDMGREAIREQIRRLTVQHEEILREQDRMVKDLLNTYYDGILLEIEAKGPKSSWEQTRKCCEKACADAQRARALAKAQLYIASGQGEEFREAAREALATGVDEAQVRYLEAVYFHMKGDLRHALHGYRKVMELTLPEGAAEESLTLPEAQRLASKTVKESESLTSQQSALGDRARGMAWMLEHAYLDRIDQKAEGEAASLRTELDEKLAKGGDASWLSSVIAHLKMGVVSATEAIVMREDGAVIVGKENALETLSSSFQNDVAKQHCGILLLKSFHERGIRIDHLDALNNDEFRALVREIYPGAGEKVDADGALRMRAAIKAAYNNPDVKRLLTVPKQMLDVDTGTPYFDKSDYEETLLQWAGDAINVWNVGTMLAPMSTYTVGGKVAWFPRWGWVGEARPVGEAIVSAKEAFSAAIGLNKLPALLAQSPAGQKVLQQFSQFFAKSTWLEDRALDMSIQLAAGKVGEAAGGTIGVLRGTDGRTEAEAGRMLAELFTAWGAGDVDVMKACMEKHGITPEHLRALIEASEQTSTAAKEAAELGSGHSQALRQVLDAVPENGVLPGEARLALESTSGQVKRMLDEVSEQFRKGEAGAAWRKLEELQIARQACAAVEAGAIPEARAWQELLDKRVRYWGGCTESSAALANRLRQAGASAVPGSKPGTVALLDFHVKDNLAGDLRRMVLQGEWGDAVAGYNQRLAVLRQLGTADAPPVQRMAREVKRIEGVALARAHYSASAPVPEGPQNEVAARRMQAALSPDAEEARKGIAALDSDANTILERQAKPGEVPTYSDPHWVKYRGANGAEETLAVAKGSGKDFPDHYDMRGEQVYADFAKEVRLVDELGKEVCGVNVPECAVGKMSLKELDPNGVLKTVEKECLVVRYVPGTQLKDLPQEVAIAFKEQIACDKVLAALLGDHDRHLGNYLITADGRIWSIDHGMADVAGRNFREFSQLVDADEVAQYMRKRILDGTRSHWGLEWLDNHITLEDMEPMIKQVEALCKDEQKLRAILSRHLSGAELDNAVKVLGKRAGVLRDVMRECFGSAEDPLVVPLPTPRAGAAAFDLSIAWPLPRAA